MKIEMNEYLQFMEIREQLIVVKLITLTLIKRIKKIELSGSQIVNRTENYTFKDGVFTVDISGTKHDYYLKGSEAYNEALKKIWIRLERIYYGKLR